MARKSRKRPVNTNAAVVTEKTYKVAIYARLSTQTDKDSIQNQVDLARQFIIPRPNLKLTAIFSDEGATGTNFARPGFAQMMQEVGAGKVNCVVVKDAYVKHTLKESIIPYKTGLNIPKHANQSIVFSHKTMTCLSGLGWRVSSPTPPSPKSPTTLLSNRPSCTRAES